MIDLPNPGTPGPFVVGLVSFSDLKDLQAADVDTSGIEAYDLVMSFEPHEVVAIADVPTFIAPPPPPCDCRGECMNPISGDGFCAVEFDRWCVAPLLWTGDSN